MGGRDRCRHKYEVNAGAGRDTGHHLGCQNRICSDTFYELVTARHVEHSSLNLVLSHLNTGLKLHRFTAKMLEIERKYFSAIAIRIYQAESKSFSFSLIGWDIYFGRDGGCCAAINILYFPGRLSLYSLLISSLGGTDSILDHHHQYLGHVDLDQTPRPGFNLPTTRRL